MTPPPIWIHVGLPKCASTFLQGQVFDRHPDINFLGINRVTGHAEDAVGTQMRYPAYGFLRYLKDTEELVFDRDALVATLGASLDAPAAVAVVSDEDLTFPDKVDRVLKARRLKAAFPDAQILIVLRNQLDWVESFYLFELRKSARFFTMEEYLARNWRDLEKSNFRIIRYAELLEAYLDIFGEERVSVLLYEDLRDGAEAFLASVCTRLGIDPERLPKEALSRRENVRMPQVVFGISRRFPILYRARAWLPRGLKVRLREYLVRKARPSKSELPPDWRKTIADYCAPGNRAIEARLGLPLAAKGYPV